MFALGTSWQLGRDWRQSFCRAALKPDKVEIACAKMPTGGPRVTPRLGVVFILIVPSVPDFMVRSATAASNSLSGTAASFCQFLACRGDTPAACNRSAFVESRSVKAG